MAQQEIEVLIAPDGNVNISVNGCPGKACEDLTKPLEDALGIVTKNTRTPEYNHRTGQQAKQK